MQGFTLRVIFENTLKIARHLKRVQFERFFRCHQQRSPLIGRFTVMCLATWPKNAIERGWR